jgi:hypothetical protein
MKSAKSVGVQRFNAELRAIMDKHGCARKEALEIRRSGQNGTTRRVPNVVGGNSQNADQIGRATEVRIEFLTATISGIRQQLEAYQEELGKLVQVAKALDIDVSEQTEQAISEVAHN